MAAEFPTPISTQKTQNLWMFSNCKRGLEIITHIVRAGGKRDWNKTKQTTEEQPVIVN